MTAATVAPAATVDIVAGYWARKSSTMSIRNFPDRSRRGGDGAAPRDAGQRAGPAPALPEAPEGGARPQDQRERNFGASWRTHSSDSSSSGSKRRITQDESSATIADHRG